MYHASMSDSARSQSHSDFVNDKTAVMVATGTYPLNLLSLPGWQVRKVAYGMGIDKADVRLIIHYGLTKTLEEYYQQVGLSLCLAFSL